MKVLKITVVLLLATFSVFGQQADGKKSFAQDADALLKKAIEDKEFVGVSAGFSVDGQIKWENGAGFSDSENEKPFSAQTLTRIASVAKPMTAIAIMQLFEQQKIDLDEPIQKYVSDFPVKKEGAITTRQLLAHTSGIDDYKSDSERENKKDYANLSDAVDLFKGRDLVAAPGKEYHYTTYGYVLLGLIIERVSGMTYEAYMKENIWAKAGMEHTGIEYAGKDYAGKSMLYHKNSKGKIKEESPSNLSDRVPGGGIYSTTTDLLKFGDAVISHKLIQEASLKIMLEDQKLKQGGNGYGLGWYLYGENPKYGNVIGHNGAQTGASAQLMLLPEQKIAIIVLSNTSGSMQRASNISVQLFDIAAASKVG